jgi:hypothetical protein
MKLAKKDGHAPHYLSMTATPIPRTLALTIYGDLDLSIIDEMPAGRKQVITEIVNENKRDGAYEKIKEELSSGRQMYVICPKIEGALEGGQSFIGMQGEEVGLNTSEGLVIATARTRSKFSPENLSTRVSIQSDLKAVTSEARRLKKRHFPKLQYRYNAQQNDKRKERKSHA